MSRTQKYLALRKAAVKSLQTPDIDVNVFLGEPGINLTFKDCATLNRIIQDDYASNILNHGFALITDAAYEEEEKVLVRCSYMLKQLGTRCWNDRKEGTI